MITEIEIENFKSFEKVHLKLGGLNLFIGANASGKSNFFDALRVLQGIAYGFTIDEVFNGKPKGAGSEVWEGIRGGTWSATFEAKGLEDLVLPPTVRFRVVGTCQGQSFRHTINMLPRFPVVNETAEPAGGVARELFRSTLGNLQQLTPVSSLLRGYSQTRFAPRMGERGENFAALVQAILQDDGRRSAYLSWLRQLTPMELDDVVILEGAVKEPLFALREGARTLPASILSDGTLHFAAITAAFFQPEMPAIITLEEIENGIHPSRLRLLLELLKTQSGGSGPQVFATTHSPVVLAWLEEKDYATTFLFKRDEATGASTVTPLSEIPHLIELVRKQPLGELFTEGWLEGAF
ncbi:MAG TPA: hypothetical protein DD490_18560 [Acidobacteria bacterium]|nr:hypothetical protein [Acidobacteriota bacterium]